MKSVHLALLGVFFGFIIAAIGILSGSIVTERQAILSLGYYDLQDPPALGDFIFVGPDDTIDHSSVGAICQNADGVLRRVTSYEEGIRAFQVSWKYSDIFHFLPWRTSVELPVASIGTTPFAELMNAIEEADNSCEAILAERSRNSCLLVVSSVAVMEDGNNLISLSGCQLIGVEAPGADDSLPGISSLGARRRYKDIYADVTVWERTWVRLQEPFIRTANVD